MKAKVIKKFKDKLSDFKIREVGEIIEVNNERYDELIKSPLGVFVEVINEEEGGQETDLENLTKKELVDHGSNLKLKLDMKMTKEEMIEEIKKVVTK